jgi:two-component system, sporulation sensor kinase E
MSAVDVSKKLNTEQSNGGMGLGESKSNPGKAPRVEGIVQIALGLAHEIRDPLTIIKGYLQFLEKNSFAASRQEALTTVFQELDRIEALITNFISLAREKTIQKTPQNLNRILVQLYPLIETYTRERQITNEWLLSERLPLLALNADAIKLLIMNLVRNGVEAMPAGGKLTIATIREAGKVVLYVGDEGNGITPEQKERIFDPFYTTKAGNTGLGLVFALDIVEKHCGTIEVNSPEQAGAIFRISFPVWDRG